MQNTAQHFQTEGWIWVIAPRGNKHTPGMCLLPDQHVPIDDNTLNLILSYNSHLIFLIGV